MANSDQAKKKKLWDVLKVTASLILFIVLWFIISLNVGDSVLPSPLLTLQTMISDFQGGKLIPALGITLLRVLQVFLITLILGTAIGCLLGLCKPIKSLFGYWIVIGTSIPPLVIIIVVFLGMGLSEASAVTAGVLTTIFSVVQNIEQGVKSLDKKLIEMGRTFNASKWLLLRKVILPQIYPYIMASARFGLSLSWKMVIFVEQMGRSNGIGYGINHWYQMYDMAHVLSYALVFIVVMLIIELILNNVIEPLLFKWRPKAA